MVDKELQQNNSHAVGPKVGVGVLVLRNGKVLMGERRGSHGEGTWAPPGGHLEYGERWEECAKRETYEETGLEIKDVEFFTCTNDVYPEIGKHYVTIFMRARWVEGNPINYEPEKCVRWEWFQWNDLPSPLFKPMESIVRQGYNPSLTVHNKKETR